MLLYICSFISLSHKSISIILGKVVLFFSKCMFPTRFGYRELGIELIELERDLPQCPKMPPMAEEKRDYEEGYPIKIFLEESLM